MVNTDFEPDIIIVGAGIAGASLAYALGKDGRNVLLLERDLREPDRIVGELLQPGGVQALHHLGLLDCLESIDSIESLGYALFSKGQKVTLKYPMPPDAHFLPYPRAYMMQNGSLAGRSFHHGRLITNLRKACAACSNIKTMQVTVSGLIHQEEDRTKRIIGATATMSIQGIPSKCNFYAPLVVVADGCFSKFRKHYLRDMPVHTCSYFVGLILHDVKLPFPNHGHVILSDPCPVLIYQIGARETRILVDVPVPLPSQSDGSLQKYLRGRIMPQLPESLQNPFSVALNTQSIRTMPNSVLSSSRNTIPGLIIIGDASNMRHPLTGGGMTVALNDVLILKGLWAKEKISSFSDTAAVAETMQMFCRKRCPRAFVINVLAQALYQLFFVKDDPSRQLLRDACFHYFLLGGTAQNDPMSLLSGMSPSPAKLIIHFLGVTFYGMYHHLCCTGPWYLFPQRILACLQSLWTACCIIFPLLYAETVY